MRFTQAEKYQIIRLVETSEIGVNRTLKEIGLHKIPSTTGTLSIWKKAWRGWHPNQGPVIPIGTVSRIGYVLKWSIWHWITQRNHQGVLRARW